MESVIESESPIRRFHAPGRVNLIGEHTDYTGGLVLPAAIDRGVTLTGRATKDGRIRLTSASAEGEVDVAADGSQPPAEGWGRYVAAVAAELDDLGRPSVGFEGHLTSDLPDGVGLSSSAALEVVLGTALCAVADFDVDLLDLAAAAQRAELRGVGVPCGIMDQAASLLGKRDHAVLLDCGTLEHSHVPLPPSLALVILDSGVRRELGESAYAERRTELEHALEALSGRLPKDVGVDEVPLLAKSAGLDELHTRRLRHVVSENARVREVRTALTAGPAPDLIALGRLFAAGHASLRNDFEVSVPALDALVDLSVQAGAVAARMTGGGFGGAIVVLVEAAEVDRIVDEVVAAYDRLGHGTGRAIAARAADGAAEISD